MELLDNPHPLDQLSEVGAYGPDGAISRYHNPANYTRALGGVLRSRNKHWCSINAAAAAASESSSSGSGKQRGGDNWMQLGQGVVPMGGLWFLPPKGTVKVRIC